MFGNKRVSTLIAGAIFGFVLGIVAITVLSRWQTNPSIRTLIKDPEASSKIQIDAPAPDFNLNNLDGQGIRLSDLQGKVVIINFWATWCGPCRVEMPLLQERFEKYSDQLVVLAINSQDTVENATEFVQEFDLTFDILLDSKGEVHQKYFVRGFPTTFLVDSEGVLRIQHVGILNGKQIDGFLEDLGMRY
jgi:DsbE subfamily thiol:disulfide oxidoreductase